MKYISEEQLLKTLLSVAENTQDRFLVALAGAPASGKTTLAEKIVCQLNSLHKNKVAAAIPQDGFHYDDGVLRDMLRLKYKGAPDTFDVNGFYSLLKRLKVEAQVAVPVFDRSIEVSRNCARIISPENKILIVEGNYLLLNQVPWDKLLPLFNTSIFLDVPLKELKRRLIQRWLDMGYTPEQVEQKAVANDMKNAHTVLDNSVSSNYVIQFSGE